MERPWSSFPINEGKSDTEGTTLPEAQAHLCRDLKVDSAMILDNGADVRAVYRGRELVRPFFDRPEIRSILALMVPKGTTWATEGLVSVS